MESRWKAPESQAGLPFDPETARDVEAFRTAYQTRNFEVGLFWQRSNDFSVLNTAIAAGFFVLVNADWTGLAVLLGLMGAWVSVLWVRVNAGSKYWQARWEQRLECVEKKVFGSDSKLFALDWIVTDREVKRSLENMRKSDPGWLRDHFDASGWLHPPVST